MKTNPNFGGTLEFLKKIALTLWTNHRKKLITFVLGLLFAGMAAISGVPLEEIKDAAHEASKPASVEMPAPVQLPATEKQ